jgi:hypothetical protein
LPGRRCCQASGKKRANETFLEPLFRLLPGNWKSIAARDVAIALLAEALSPTRKACKFSHHPSCGSAPRGRLNSGLQTQASGVVFTASIHIHISCWGMLWLVSLHLRRRHRFNGGSPRFSFSS